MTPQLLPARPHLSPLTAATHTILVADDDDDLRDLVCHKLRARGFDTLTADNGAAALELARTHRPDAIVLDVTMPQMDGLDVCHQLQAAPETAAIPVLICSARTRGTDVDLGLTLGAGDYVTKPFSLADLVRRVEGLLP